MGLIDMVMNLEFG